MKRLVLLAGLALVAGCNRDGTPMKGFRHMSDRLKAATGGWFGEPCEEQSKDSPGYMGPTSARDCYRFDPSRRMSGIWINGYEQSLFVPAGSAMDDPNGAIFSLGDDPGGSALPRDRFDNLGKTYAIVFDGSRSVAASRRHGTSIWVVLVDRVISIREIKRPAPGTIVPVK